MFSKDFYLLLPNWFFTVASLLILLGMSVAIWWVVLGAKRFSETMNRENQVIKLKDEIKQLTKQCERFENDALQLNTSYTNFQNLLSEILELLFLDSDETIGDNAYELIQRTIDSLSSDMKSTPGDRHRCGIWMEGEAFSSLVLVRGSSEFPRSEIGNKILKTNFSIAGKAFSQQRTIHIPDLTEESDWVPNANSNFKYSSMIAVPLKRYGVLTIDAIKPLRAELVCIAESYAIAIELLLTLIYFNSETDDELDED